MGSATALTMKSGDLFKEYPVVSTKFSKPPPEPGPSTKALPMVLTVAVPWLVVETLEKPRPPIVACGPSTERPRANLPPKSLTTRNPYCRAQLKPTWYCESTVIGRTSVRFVIPFLVSVANDHC
ncbi:MAG: hypothetical protein DMG78_22975 [Acidobacteria bacterium]|nr:MAG: hypothetical protein DMG78_22975 [Acidobacteriota bacterium]